MSAGSGSGHFHGGPAKDFILDMGLTRLQPFGAKEISVSWEGADDEMVVRVGAVWGEVFSAAISQEAMYSDSPIRYLDHIIDRIGRELAAAQDRSYRARDQVGKALGFRAWKFKGHQLFGPSSGLSPWNVGEPTTATCTAPLHDLQLPSHRAPDQDCRCGLYACHNPDDIPVSVDSDVVLGAVLAWGRIRCAPRDFRAEFAQPVLFGFSKHWPWERVERIRALAGEWDLPCVEEEDFLAEALKLGDPIPMELRPDGMTGELGTAGAFHPAAPPSYASGGSVRTAYGPGSYGMGTIMPVASGPMWNLHSGR